MIYTLSSPHLSLSFFPSFFQEDTIPGRPFDFTFDSPSSHSDGRMEEGDDT
jgi:hypothetical protein